MHVFTKSRSFAENLKKRTDTATAVVADDDE